MATHAHFCPLCNDTEPCVEDCSTRDVERAESELPRGHTTLCTRCRCGVDDVLWALVNANTPEEARLGAHKGWELLKGAETLSNVLEGEARGELTAALRLGIARCRHAWVMLRQEPTAST